MKITSALNIATICLALTACSEQNATNSQNMPVLLSLGNMISGTNVQKLPKGEMLVTCNAGIGGCYNRMTALCPIGFNELERISKPKISFQNETSNIRFKCK